MASYRPCASLRESAYSGLAADSTIHVGPKRKRISMDGKRKPRSRVRLSITVASAYYTRRNWVKDPTPDSEG